MSNQTDQPVGPTAGKMVRRQFLRMAGLGGTGAALATQIKSPSTAPASADSQTMPMRNFGRADVRISAIGFGGHHLGEFALVEDAIKQVHEAIDAGITFFDNCWEYFNGRTENWMGRALKGRRDKVFLMTKVCTHGRSAGLALQMLEESLRRLQTDHLDLWQIHGVAFDNDPALAYAPGGVLEALDRAKRDGKTRFVGFTGHKDPALHLEMIRHGYPFDAVQMPLNIFDGCFRSFEQQVLPDVNRRGMAALGMKPMGGTADAIKSQLVTPDEMLRYAMSLPVATTITGMDNPEILRQNLRIAREFQPMNAEEMQALRERCAPVAGDGRYELYKLSLRFDNPQARTPHGFPLDKTEKEVNEMLNKDAGGP